MSVLAATLIVPTAACCAVIASSQAVAGDGECKLNGIVRGGQEVDRASVRIDFLDGRVTETDVGGVSILQLDGDRCRSPRQTR